MSTENTATITPWPEFYEKTKWVLSHLEDFYLIMMHHFLDEAGDWGENFYEVLQEVMIERGLFANDDGELHWHFCEVDDETVTNLEYLLLRIMDPPADENLEAALKALEDGVCPLPEKLKQENHEPEVQA